MNDVKVVLLTGGARGIGAATANLFSENGYNVANFDILENTELRSDRSINLQVDVSSEYQIKEAISKVKNKWGKIDVLVNIAGVVLVKPIEETEYSEFEKIVNVNLGGTFLMIKHVIPIFKEQGHGIIVNMASVSGHVGQVNHSLYGATKGGILAMVRALAWELAPYNIRINSVSPGSVDTEMLRSDIKSESIRLNVAYEELKKEREEEQAFKRWADPREIAEVIYFLSSEKASYINGADILVDNGWTSR